MKIKCGYSMGYAGTDSEWTADIPEEIIANGQEAIAAYVEEVQQEIWENACEKVSAWAHIME